MTIRQSLLALSLIFVLPISAMAQLSVDNAWVREAPPVATVAAAYMHITNNSDTQRKMIAVSSDVAGHSEIHSMSMQDDMMTMQKIDNIVIEPGETVELAPGGLHIMLMQLKSPVKEGQRVDISIEFADGEIVDVQAPVKRVQ